MGVAWVLHWASLTQMQLPGTGGGGGGGGVLLQFRFDLLSLECSLRTCIPGNASASGNHILGKKSGMFSRPDGELWEQ